MAELLVHEELPVTAASRCVVWNKGIKKHVEGIVEDAGADFPPIELESPNRRHWFTNFAEGGKSSLVKGPQEIKLEFENACEEIAEERGKHVAAAPFRTLTRLLMGLQADFGCISHCDELVGLESENGIHKLTVDNHTKEVVASFWRCLNMRTLKRNLNGSSSWQHICTISEKGHDLDGTIMAASRKSTPTTLSERCP